MNDFFIEDELDDFMDSDVKQTSDNNYTQPEEWTIISALDHVLNCSVGCGLSNDFWQNLKAPLAFLREQLQLTDVQIVIIAILIENGEAMSWRMIAKHLGCTRLSVMVHTEEMNDLLRKRWIVKKAAHERMQSFEGFALAHGVVTALRHNQMFIPEKIDGFTIQQFMDRIKFFFSNTHSFFTGETLIDQLIEANQQLPLCKKIKKYDTRHQYIFLKVADDYAQYADTEGEGLHYYEMKNELPNDWESDILFSEIAKEANRLQFDDLIEFRCNDGIVDTNRLVLTEKSKKELLADFEPSVLNKPDAYIDNDITGHDEIAGKTMYFNHKEQDEIERLIHMLSQENFANIQERLEECGMRQGVACLFYGAPGTGKTETVLQLARKTGRDIYRIDIAGIRDKWVGETEKNIKRIFSKYREICNKAEVKPILFFNEADAIFNKRNENAERSVDKMDNAMQNIILQEMETLNGILIATTNLTSNLDKAFERRFLFKIEFKKPCREVRALIWLSMMDQLTQEDALRLADKYEFTGGQIENISRKCTIDYIISGKQTNWENIDKNCQTELINAKSNRNSIGFTSN